MCLNMVWFWWKEAIDYQLCSDTRVTVCSGCQLGQRNWLIFHLILYSSSRQPWLWFQQTLKVMLCSDMNGLRKETHSMLFLCLLSLQAVLLFMIAFCSLACFSLLSWRNSIFRSLEGKCRLLFLFGEKLCSSKYSNDLNVMTLLTWLNDCTFSHIIAWSSHIWGAKLVWDWLDKSRGQRFVLFMVW